MNLLRARANIVRIGRRLSRVSLSNTARWNQTIHRRFSRRSLTFIWIKIRRRRCHENASDCLRLDRCGGDAGDTGTCLLLTRLPSRRTMSRVQRSVPAILRPGALLWSTARLRSGAVWSTEILRFAATIWSALLRLRLDPVACRAGASASRHFGSGPAYSADRDDIPDRPALFASANIWRPRCTISKPCGRDLTSHSKTAGPSKPNSCRAMSRAESLPRPFAHGSQQAVPQAGGPTSMYFRAAIDNAERNLPPCVAR